MLSAANDDTLEPSQNPATFDLSQGVSQISDCTPSPELNEDVLYNAIQEEHL